MKVDIRRLLGASDEIMMKVAGVSPLFKIDRNEWELCTRSRLCGESDLPDGRGQFGVAINWKLISIIPISISADGELEIITIEQLIATAKFNLPGETIVHL